MFDTTQIINSHDGAPTKALDALRCFAEEHHAALQHAAALLGGKPGLLFAQAALDGLKSDYNPSPRTIRLLEDLNDLFHLKHIEDPSRIEAARFAAICPASSCVEDICFLADGLADALMIYRESEEQDQQSMIGKAVA